MVDIIGQLLLDALFLALLEERGAMFEVAVGICLLQTGIEPDKMIGDGSELVVGK